MGGGILEAIAVQELQLHLHKARSGKPAKPRSENIMVMLKVQWCQRRKEHQHIFW